MRVIFVYCGVEHAILSSHMQYVVMERQLKSLSNSMMNLPDVVQMGSSSIPLFMVQNVSSL